MPHFQTNAKVELAIKPLDARPFCRQRLPWKVDCNSSFWFFRQLVTSYLVANGFHDISWRLRTLPMTFQKNLLKLRARNLGPLGFGRWCVCFLAAMMTYLAGHREKRCRVWPGWWFEFMVSTGSATGWLLWISQKWRQSPLCMYIYIYVLGANKTRTTHQATEVLNILEDWIGFHQTWKESISTKNHPDT